jgi:tyrosyl-tRNA synthetase
MVLDPARTEIRYNSEWCEPLGATGMIQLAAKYTVARMMERNDFHDRFKAGNPISGARVSLPADAGLRLGGPEERPGAGRHGPEVQSAHGPPFAAGIWPGAAVRAHHAAAGGAGRHGQDVQVQEQLHRHHRRRQHHVCQGAVDFGHPDVGLVHACCRSRAWPRSQDAKVALAKEITARFHSAAAAEAAEQDFINRSKGGVPEDIPEVALTGAPLGIGALLKQANLAPSTSEANRLIDGGGVRVDGGVVSDRGLKLDAGTYVVQVGKRKFARVNFA